MQQCKQLAEKLSGYIDGELTQQASQQVRLHIESCKDCQQLHSDLLDMQVDIKNITTTGGEDAALENIMKDTTATNTQHWGWILLISGSIALMGVSVYQFIMSNELSVFEKLITGSMGLGGFLLFLSVVRQRLIALKTDKYKDINL